MKKIMKSYFPSKLRAGSAMSFALAMIGLAVGAGTVSAKPKQPESAPLTTLGKKLEAQYSASLKSLQTEITRALPRVDERRSTAVRQAREAVGKATADYEAAQKNLGKINGAKGLVAHAKGKWIGGAEKGIAQAEAALKKATTDAEREAANQELAKWQANKEDGLQALKERQAAYDKAKIDESKFKQAAEAAKAVMAKAKATELEAVNSLLTSLDSFLASEKLDAKLAQAVVLSHATPRGLAEFAQQGSDKETLVEKLLLAGPLMKEMLIAGGAKYGEYGRATEIYATIRKSSPNAKEGILNRLALATSLEHARPIAQSKAEDETNVQTTVDPLKRYLHYEKAYLAGELDPAFEHFDTWELRKIVDCDAPDKILSWGRQMLRNYRPDHIYNPNYGWRYASTVKTEVPYGSQNVKYDLPSLHKYQNIVLNGGVCGRRAFFGRFLLKSFGIPVWGVTQHKHAALSHWTPKGWVVNLGAGFQSSWWDKDEVSLSGSQFQIETQARKHAKDYLKVLRAQWVSRILGEEAYNDRRNVAGGFWSSTGHYQSVVLASQAITLGPLGQELGEANEKQKVVSESVSKEEQEILIKDGAIRIPAVAHGKTGGKSAAMKSFLGGMQLHCLGGFKTEYTFDVPRDGKYALSARVATVQKGQKFLIGTNAAKAVETDVPFTVGMWEQTEAMEVDLDRGKNTFQFELKNGSRGVTIKDFTLIPVK